MPKFAATLTLTVFMSFVFPAYACHVVQPIPGATDKFEAIFVGEVTGIRLRGYENIQMGMPDACDVVEEGEEPACFNITSDPSVLLFVLPRVVVRGKVQDVQALDQSGCNRDGIAMKDRGIFFVNPGGASAAIVWEGQPGFSEWLERLNVHADAFGAGQLRR